MRAHWLLGLWALGACQSYAPPSAAWRASLARPPELEARACARFQAVVRIESEELSGTFQAALARRGRDEVRLKLFSDLGGSVLDLCARADRIQGRFPQVGIELDWSRAHSNEPPLGFLSLLAISLLEEDEELDLARVRGVRAADNGWRVRLAPRLEGVRVEAEVDARGTILRREFAFRGARWREERAEGRRFEAPGLRWTLEEIVRTPVETLPDSLFAFEAREGRP
jgi:hypothetical protein